MTDNQLKALRIVIDMLDEEMEDTPSRELADVSNYLETKYQEHTDAEV